jgi:D-aminopeptidase
MKGRVWEPDSMIDAKVAVKFDESIIDAIFRDLDQSHLPGAAVGIAVDGRPIYRKGFGLASMELPIALSPRTRMRIYSTTKHFTCLAYLLLCEGGKAGVDDPVVKFLPELHPVTHRVTMRQLMCNTSGLRDACEIRWVFSGIDNSVSSHELLGSYRDIPDVNFAPGDAWCYNNGGFHILTAVIERLEAMPLEQVLRKRLFEPAGMSDTLLRRTDSDFVANSATMHMKDLAGAYEKRYLPAELAGEGGIVSTVDDMLRWLSYVTRPDTDTTRAWALMNSPHKLNRGAETGYAFGLHQFRYRGVKTVSHGGGGLGSNCQMIHVPSAGLDVFVCANRHDVSSPELAARVLEVCLGLTLPEPDRGAERVTGVFCCRSTGRVIALYDKADKQMAVVDGCEEWALMSSGGALCPDPSRWWSLVLKCHGKPENPDSLEYECFGHTERLVPLAELSRSTIAGLEGAYEFGPMGIRLDIEASGEHGWVKTSGRFGSTTYRLERYGNHFWRFTEPVIGIWGGIVTAGTDGMSLTVRTARNWGINFGRVS